MPARRKKRVAAVAGVQSFLSPLDRRVIAGFVCQAARALRELASTPDVLMQPASLAAERPPNLDAWNLPDCAWNAMLRSYPTLQCYPLGEVIERAAKRALAETFAQAGVYPGAPVRPASELLGVLRQSLDADELVQRFAVRLFFDMALDAIRRGSSIEEKDFAYRYHFTPTGRSVSLEAEQRWRQRLLEQCEVLASGFLPFLWRSLDEQSVAGVESRISEGLREILDSPPSAAAHGTIPVTDVLVSDRWIDGVPVANLPANGPLQLVLKRPGGNVSISCRRQRAGSAPQDPAAEKAAGDRPPGLPASPLVQDMIELGAALYVADLMVPRQLHLGRRIRMVMSVRELDRWQQAREDVERAVSFLGRDDFTIRFEPRDATPQGGAALRFDEDLKESTCVCLLSGGLDSLGGVVSLLDRRERPVLVSHYASRVLGGMQQSLVEELATALPSPNLDHLGFYVARSVSSAGEPPRSPRLMPQYLRAFLFLSLACGTAMELGVERVYMPENGPLALNPSFSEARVNTRSAHPQFLAAFQRLVRGLSSHPITIANPFLYNTKGEVASVLSRPRLEPLIARTTSCWNWSRVPFIAGLRGGPKGARQCGECLPCVGRRIALHTAGLSSHDAAYLTDIFEDGFAESSRVPRDRQTAILDYLRFCRRIEATEEGNFLIEWPDFSLHGEGVDGARLAAMFRRSGSEAMRCFAERGSGTLRKKIDLAA